MIPRIYPTRGGGRPQTIINPNRAWNGGNWVGSSSTNTGWRLGVTGDNTDAGVVVRQVTPNSPAARAGISPGDAVVCVAEDQVGRVGNRIFDLGEEINHHTDSSGRVLMLVNYGSTGQLRPINTRLDNQSGGLSGTLVVRGGTLPQNSMVTVRLENVTRPYQAVRNGQYSFRLSSFNMGEIPFSLNYDPTYISNTAGTNSGRTLPLEAEPSSTLPSLPLC